MDSNWFPAVATSSALLVAAWLARNLIKTRLTNSVKHEFDSKLEALRAEFRRAEELLRGELRAKEAEISALRSGALTAMATRHVAVDARRIEAVDQIWSAVGELARVKPMLAIMSVVKFDTAAERAQEDSKVRQMFTAVSGDFDFQKVDLAQAAKARPFISLPAWATYTALLTLMLYAVMRLHILRTGASPEIVVGEEALLKVLKITLPDQTEFIDNYGAVGFPVLAEQLETKLLHELQVMLKGSEADKASVEQAAEILKATGDAMRSLEADERTAGRAV